MAVWNGMAKLVIHTLWPSIEKKRRPRDRGDSGCSDAAAVANGGTRKKETKEGI
jgi:hypothetical protein